jgi:hypothetical protein
LSTPEEALRPGTMRIAVEALKSMPPTLLLALKLAGAIGCLLIGSVVPSVIGPGGAAGTSVMVPWALLECPTLRGPHPDNRGAA